MRSVLVFLRVSTEDQSLTNQRFEVSSYLTKRGISPTCVKYVTMKGSSFRRVHPVMKQHIDDLLALPNKERPSEIVFAAVDRFCRDCTIGTEIINTLMNMDITVRFARTPHLDILTSEGWGEFQTLLQAAELESINNSTRAKIYWERRRIELAALGDETSTIKKRPRDGDSYMAPPDVKRIRPSSYLFSTMTQEKKNEYDRDLLYLIYMFGHDSATVLDLMRQVEKIHKTYSPELQESTYGIRTGKRHWQSYEVFVGDDEDFSNILNVYRLSPSGPGAYDRWSSDAINEVFETLLPKVVPQNRTLLNQEKFLDLVKIYEFSRRLIDVPITV